MPKVMSFWAQTKARIKWTDIPLYFKIVRAYALSIGGILGSLKITALALPDPAVAAWVNNILEYGIAICGTVAAVCILPTPNHALGEAATPKQAEKIEAKKDN